MLILCIFISFSATAQDEEERKTESYHFIGLQAQKDSKIAFNYHHLSVDPFLGLTPYVSMYKSKNKFVYISSFNAPETVNFKESKFKDLVSEFNYANTQMQGFQSKYFHADYNNPYQVQSPKDALFLAGFNYLIYSVFKEKE